eukprot:CAMPEP_0197060190 /NCGR_PEP_ID=MMETSP1384-20130603/124845_1 /TAXON_ID=29189 /ORGANISM="Ammonia sp." /LENGTH=53 /DNA_ID=CAMNT_0042495477 /DNA_START=42 /DNA_END=203 /DNA_ORIENTATION=-
MTMQSFHPTRKGADYLEFLLLVIPEQMVLAVAAGEYMTFVIDAEQYRVHIAAH